MKKIISLILVLFMASALFISCGDDSPDSADNNRGDNNAGIGVEDNNQDNEEETARERLQPDLPEMDFGGYTFTFYAHQISYPGDWVGDADPRELVAEEETADPINDAVYRRNMTIKDRYNIEIEMITSSNDLGLIRRAVGAGDSTYDAAVIFNNNVGSVATNNLLVNIENLPFIDLNKPWWDPAVNSLSIANQNFLMAGDLLILDNEATNALLFNKDMMANFGLDLPYQSVKDGTWTMDALNEIIRDTAADLDGSGVMTVNDRWGMCVYSDALHAFFVGGGGILVDKDENDLPYISFTSTQNISFIEKAMDLMYNTDYVINISGRDHTDGLGMFEENRALFYWMRMRVVEHFRGMESNFGIVPIPKYNDAQENYRSVVNPYSGVLLGVPRSAEDLDRVSIILEALAAESRYTLQPAYYDVTLQRKYVRDDESSDMLDIIFGTRVYDMGGIYAFGNVWIDFINLAGRNNRDIISFYERKTGSMEREIERAIEAFLSAG